MNLPTALCLSQYEGYFDCNAVHVIELDLSFHAYYCV